MKSKLTLPLDAWPMEPARAFGLKGTTLAIPKTFSLIEEPSETLRTLIRLRRILSVPTLCHIDADWRSCERLDLCASVVSDVLTMKAKVQRKFRRGKLRVSGTFSGRPEIDIMLVSSGILKHLGTSISRNLPPELRERLRFSELRVGRRSPPNVTSDIELAATDLAEFFDECLRTERHQLKSVWKSNLIQLITEVLDNAEEHGSGERIWYTIGYYNRHDDESEGGECHIAIFNFGDSIYESLNRPDTSEELKRQIGDLADIHRNKGYFAMLNRNVGLFIPTWEEESLWTLYALQEGVSRFSKRPEGIDRGNGTVKMIEFFAELASGEPQMALLSGRTHILFDGRYRLTPVSIGDETRKVIAFNESNDLREKPDARYVRTLPDHFPGTLVSLRFQLKQSDLANRKEKLDADL